MDTVAGQGLVETRANDSVLNRIMAVIGAGYLFLILADPRDGLAKISIRFLLKDHLHLGPGKIASFTALTAFAWYCKPIAGLITDNFSLFGSRRKVYLLLSTGVATILWLGLSLLPVEYSALFVSLLFINIALCFAQTTFGGTLVETGQKFNATGRISSIRIGVENAGMLVAGLLGGWLASHMLGKVFAINVVILGVLVVLIWRLFREDPVEVRAGGLQVLSSTWTQIKVLFRSRMMWIAAGFWMLVRFSPGFGTSLFFYQSEVLKFSPDFIGLLTFFNCAASVLGSIGYLLVCRKVPLKSLLYFGVAVNVITTTFYFAYHSAGAAMAVEAAYGLGNALAWMAILDLLARATPKRSEALGYALIFSFGNISVSVSDVLGSNLFETFHKSFSSMVWLNTATSALVLVAIPFLPKVLVAHRDGQLTPADARE